MGELLHYLCNEIKIFSSVGGTDNEAEGLHKYKVYMDKLERIYTGVYIEDFFPFILLMIYYNASIRISESRFEKCQTEWARV